MRPSSGWGSSERTSWPPRGNWWSWSKTKFGRIDHDHLGKLLVYGSGVSANVVVWISEKLRDEHRRALDWLNENTRDGVDFFGLELELWRIGLSPAAPKFNVVSQPNGWAKAIRRQTEAGGELAAAQLEFWTAFADLAAERFPDLPLSPVSGRGWLRSPLGRAGAFVSLTHTRQLAGRIACELRIRVNSNSVFDQLEAQKVRVEASLGELEWLRLDDKQVSRIMISKKIDVADAGNWPEAHAWLARSAMDFRAAFLPLIPSLDFETAPEDEPYEAHD